MGFSFEDLIATLFILPLIGINSIYGLTTDKDPELNKCRKEPYYQTSLPEGRFWQIEKLIGGLF